MVMTNQSDHKIHSAHPKFQELCDAHGVEYGSTIHHFRPNGDGTFTPVPWHESSKPMSFAAYTGIKALTDDCHAASTKAGWWTDLHTGENMRGKRNKPEMLMLMVSELAEAMEGLRKDLMDDKIPSRKMEEVELADCIIRICDYAGAHDLDLAGAISDKMAFNAVREDHKIENRVMAGGKKF